MTDRKASGWLDENPSDWPKQDIPSEGPSDHDPMPTPHALSSAVFTTCVVCSTPVWREDSPDFGWTSLAEGTWQHVETEEQ